MTDEEKQVFIEELKAKGLLNQQPHSTEATTIDAKTIETSSFSPIDEQSKQTQITAANLELTQPAMEKIAMTDKQINAVPTDNRIWGMPTKSYTTTLHLSVFAAYFLPILGIVVPLFMWLSQRDDALVDKHGKIVINWVLSYCIYMAISGLLMFVLIGFALAPILWILSIFFSIVGAIQASEGKQWHYPGSIRFFD